jgi:hypothetical protein
LTVGIARAARAAVVALLQYGAPGAQSADATPRPTASGYRFQIVTGDDSSGHRAHRRRPVQAPGPTFAAFRTELAQRRRMVYVAIGPDRLREVARAAAIAW